MSKSYGFIEITGVVAAIDALDIMCKTADVELASWERKLGGRLVTIIVEGDVSAVTEAVNAAATGAIKETGKLCSNCTSPRRNRQNGGIKCKSLEEQSGG